MAKIPAAQLPKQPLETLLSDFDGDTRTDVLLVGADGGLLLLRNIVAPATPSKIAVAPLSVQGRLAPGFRELAAGVVNSDRKARLYWIDGRQMLVRSVLQKSAAAAKKAASSMRFAPPFPVRKTQAGQKVAVGHFLGCFAADVLVGQNLLPEGNPAHPARMACWAADG